MPQKYYATVSCPACGNRFQTPVEQILDVRVDPEAKNRMMSGMVNVSICPACGTGGPLNLPYVYHDPEKEVALLYLPATLGNSEAERQQAAGTLTRQLMDSLPQEERKGYLFQLETFINAETLVKRVLEIEGITADDMERNRLQHEFLNTFMEAEPEAWESLLAENGALVDETFFGLLQYTLQLAATSGPDNADFQHFRVAYQYIIENSKLGQLLTQRSEVISAFAENPSRETLVQALVDAPDDDTVFTLVQGGMSLLDYPFFQRLVQRIDAADEPVAKENLRALRRRILEIREELMQASQEIMMERAALLQKLLETEDLLRMARSHRSELDDTFSYVLRTELEEAQKSGNEEAFKALQQVSQVLSRVMEENMPPQVVLLRRLLMASTPQAVQELLTQNQDLLDPQFFQVLDNLVQSSQQEGNPEAVTQLTQLKAMAIRLAPPAVPSAPGSAAAQVPAPPAAQPPQENRTPSGLIIAKR